MDKYGSQLMKVMEDLYVPNDIKEVILTIWNEKSQSDLDKLDFYRCSLRTETIKNKKEKNVSMLKTIIPEEERKVYLLALLFHASYLRNVYREEGLEENICNQTMAEMILKIQKSQKYNGNILDIDYDWIQRLFCFNLIRIKDMLYAFGRTRKELEVEKNGSMVILPTNTKILEVHVPEHGSICKTKVLESMAEAEKIMKILNYDFEGFVCRSWMMSSDITILLDKDWNIYQFQQLFQRYEIPRPQNEIWKRVFECENVPERGYPYSTRLQERILKSEIWERKTITGMGGFRWKEKI